MVRAQLQDAEQTICRQMSAVEVSSAISMPQLPCLHSKVSYQTQFLQAAASLSHQLLSVLTCAVIEFGCVMTRAIIGLLHMCGVAS